MVTTINSNGDHKILGINSRIGNKTEALMHDQLLEDRIITGKKHPDTNTGKHKRWGGDDYVRGKWGGRESNWKR